MKPNVAEYGIYSLKNAVAKCEVENIDTLRFEGFLKALLRECKIVHAPFLHGSCKIIVDGEEFFINDFSNIEYYIKPYDKLVFKETAYDKELQQIRRSLKNSLEKSIKNILKYHGENRAFYLTLTPWEFSIIHFKPLQNLIVKTSLRPLGIYSKICSKEIKVKRKFEEEKVNDIEVYVKNNSLRMERKGLTIKVPINDALKALVSDDRNFFGIKTVHGRKIYGLMEGFVVFEGFEKLILNLDFNGGTLWTHSFLTTLQRELEFDEELITHIPLWLTYCSKTHGISIYTEPPGIAVIRGNALEIEGSQKIFVKLHRGCWERSGIDSLSIAVNLPVEKVQMSLSVNEFKIVEIQPKHVMATEVAFNKNSFEIVLHNFLRENIIARIRVPWKIIDAEKRSPIRNVFLGKIDYDYNIAYVPLAPNEYVKVFFKITLTPFAFKF